MALYDITDTKLILLTTDEEVQLYIGIYSIS